MSLEFLSGLALIIVTLGAVSFAIKEFFDIEAGDLKNLGRSLAGSIEKKRESREAKPINSHLIGLIGTVTAHSGDSDRPMRVRLNLESWPARLISSAAGLAPVGSSVKVAEVDGAVLIVEAHDSADSAVPGSS